MKCCFKCSPISCGLPLDLVSDTETRQLKKKRKKKALLIKLVFTFSVIQVVVTLKRLNHYTTITQPHKLHSSSTDARVKTGEPAHQVKIQESTSILRIRETLLRTIMYIFWTEKTDGLKEE